MADTYLSRTPSSQGDRRTYTISCWLKRHQLAYTTTLMDVFLNANQWYSIGWRTNDKFYIYHVDSGTDYGYVTDMLFRDMSAWYHIVLAVDTTQASASNRVKLYVNGEQVTFNQDYGDFPQNDSTWVNSTNAHHIGRYNDVVRYSQFTLAHYHFTDGTAYQASDFGETDTNGQWKPKPTPSVTYGTNGFFLKFANSGSLGTDSSGNGNNFTVSGSGDQVTDTPDNVFATLNPTTYDSSGMTFSEGNSKVIGRAGASSTAVSTQSFSSGKWYAEFKIGNTHKTRLGAKGTNWYDNNNTQIGTVYDHSGYVYIGSQESGSLDTTIPAYTTGDIIGVFVDKDNNTIKFSKNGTVHGVSQTLSQDEYAFYVFDYSGTGDEQLSVQANFGNPSFSISSGNSDVNGYGNFEYSPNDGTYDYLALCTKNLASELTLPIGDGKDYFNTVLWTSNGSNATVTGVGFQPDFVWQKTRNGARHHHLYNSSRFTSGYGTWLQSSNTDQEANLASTGLTSYSSDGFTHSFNSPQGFEINGETQVAWNWLNNGGTTSSNTDGTLTTTVQVNTTAGFSIVEWTGNGGGSTTVGHGLGVAPDMMIMHPLNVGTNWRVWHQDLSGGNYFLILDSTNVENNNEPIFTGAPSSTVVNLGSDYNGNGTTYIMFAFTTKEGYSKFGGYTGNGNADGTFVYTGFRPAFVMVKGRSTAQVWSMRDSVRDSFNSAQKAIYANTTNTESDNVNNSIDLLSNGFKIRNSFGTENSSGQTYIYMAFAEHPFVDSTGRPVTAR